MFEEGWRDGGPMWDPCPHLEGRRVLLLVNACLLASKVHHEPSNQVVAESGAMDHLNEEAVRDSIERLQDVHCFGSGRGLALVEATNHPSRDGDLAQSSLMLA